MATIKKAQKGTKTAKYKPSWAKPTPDSSAYYSAKADDMYSAYINSNNKMFLREAGEASKHFNRQKMKGKPGMDKDGFPIKQKSGGKTPMTSKQKKFASLAAPKDKITFADKIAGAKGKSPMAKRGAKMMSSGMKKCKYGCK